MTENGNLQYTKNEYINLVHILNFLVASYKSWDLLVESSIISCKCWVIRYEHSLKTMADPGGKKGYLPPPPTSNSQSVIFLL